MSNKKFSLGIGFSSLCNMDCIFCYSKEKRLDERYINLEEWLKFFDKNHNSIDSVNYGTGENSLSDDWYELIDYVRSNYPHITQALTTNGTIIEKMNRDPRKKDIVLKSIDEIDVSLDFGDREKHNYFRGNNKAYDYAIDTLKFCKDNRIKSTIVFIGLDETLEINNVDSLFKIAKENEAIVRLNIFRPTSESINLTPPKFENILKFFDWVYEYNKIISLSDPLFSSILTKNYVKEDPSGVSSLRITQEGDIYASTYLLVDEFNMGNITEVDNLEDLTKVQIVSDIKNAELLTTCKNCVKKDSCGGGALDRRFLWFNTIEEKDPYCPKNFKLPTQLREFEIESTDFTSVHDGYLPTLFFKAN